MKINILTLFPNMYDGFLSESIIKRAIDKKIVNINITNIRDFTNDKHGHVDDTPYGGGSGMLLKCEHIFNAVESVKTSKSKVILLTPEGVLNVLFVIIGVVLIVIGIITIIGSFYTQRIIE